MAASISVWRAARPALWLAGIVSAAQTGLSYADLIVAPSVRDTPLIGLLWESPIFAIAAWAGWLVAATEGGLFRAGWGGVLVFFIAHPVIHGVAFILDAMFSGMADLPLVLGGVLFSFLIFSPVFFGAGLVGAMLARATSNLRGRAT